MKKTKLILICALSAALAFSSVNYVSYVSTGTVYADETESDFVI